MAKEKKQIISKEEIGRHIKLDPQNRWYVGRLNLLDSVNQGLTPPNKVIIKDETIREGEETPGVFMTPEEKVEIAQDIENLGIKEIEVGYPSVSKRDFDLVKTLKKETNLRLSVHGRAWVPNWKEEIDVIQESGADIVWFIQVGSLERTRAPEVTPPELVTRAGQCIEYAKSIGLYVAFGLNTPARTDLNLVYEMYNIALDAGVDRIYAACDGGGCLKPETAAYLTRFVKDLAIQKNKNPELAVHCHNDYGLATFNSIAAVNAGATVVDTVVNGLGDRAGNAALEEVVCILEILYGIKTGVNIEKLYEISKKVERISGVPIAANKAIVGGNVFRHSTDDHISSLLHGEWMAFENIRAEALGTKRQLEFGPMTLQTGEDGALATKIGLMGYEYSLENVNRISGILRPMITKDKTFVTEKEVEEVIKKEYGKK